MASYNAGRSIGRLLTDGAFDALERDASGYVSAADAANQLLTRRERRGSQDDDDEAAERGSSSGDVEMRSFLETMVASFCRSKPGRLNRREFALLYETFLKRPAEFSRLMLQMRQAGGAEEADEEEEEAGGGSDKVEDDGEEKGKGAKESDTEQRREAPLRQAPQMSRDQLRSLVDEVNRRLADENEARAKQPAAAAAAADAAAAAASADAAAAAAKDIDDLHLD